VQQRPKSADHVCRAVGPRKRLSLHALKAIVAVAVSSAGKLGDMFSSAEPRAVDHDRSRCQALIEHH
jgi:hypothetical protein